MLKKLLIELGKNLQKKDNFVIYHWPVKMLVHRIINFPAFRYMLTKNSNQNPIIYLNGINLIIFIYKSEETFHDVDLDNFLKVAEDFQNRRLFDGNETNFQL